MCGTTIFKMADKFQFKIEGKIPGALGRAGELHTPHGVIHTPAFVTVGTKATVKALTPDQVRELGAEVVLANTYHLYLQPGDEVVRNAGGIHKFMNWNGPTMTDSGGFQAFSLGAAFGEKVSKIGGIEASEPTAETFSSTTERQKPLGRHPARPSVEEKVSTVGSPLPLAKITENGVEFRSHLDGSKHFFTPEKSIQIQHNIGADMIFAFDECTSPTAPYEYQKEALERTHRWAKRSLDEHKKLMGPQALFGIVQGGRFEDLRKESAHVIGEMDFDGFGIGGSFEKEDMYTAVGWVNAILPEEKPRHLLGIGEPEDLFGGIENGADLFDCVAPTRMARNGTLHTKDGRINITNAKFGRDFAPIEEGCACYTCKNFTRAYVAHLFRANEMLAGTLGSIHNLFFTVTLVKKIRQAILDGNFSEYKENFLRQYNQNKK